MTFVELCLRLGLVLAAWLLVLAHCMWLAVLPRIDCLDNGALPWFLTLAAAPLAIASACVLPTGRQVPGVAHLLRLLAVPLPVLLPLAGWAAGQGLVAVTFGDSGFCASRTVAAWEVWWAPVQVAALGAILWGSVRAWRRSG